jgi:aryl-alcohol dehydrogenase
MRIKAALVEAPSAAFTFETLELDEPRDEEVLVRIVATGLCQTDIHVRDQHYPVPLPIVLGHEGAGVVERVGASVTGIEPGDHVVLSFPSCGHCRPCRTGHNAYCESGFSLCFGGSRPDGSSALHRLDGAAPLSEVHGAFFAQSSFATHALATASNIVKVPHDVPLELLGPLGCGFQTGAGAVFNSLRVRAGASIAILGVGAVGLAAVMAARVAGAGRIIAVDINTQRLALAAELGATHIINGGTEDVAARIAEITGGGVDYSLEITGLPKMLRMAVDLLAPLGIAALIGGAPAGAEAAIDMNGLLGGRTVRGVAQGDSVPQVFIPMLIDMYRQGVFPFDRLIRFYDFEDINAAVEDTRRGNTVKAVLRIGTP